MRSLILVFAFLFMPSIGFGDGMESLVKERLCHARFAYSLNEYEKVVGTWFRPSRPEKNVNANFSILRAKHEEHLAAISEFAKRTLSVDVSSIQSLQGELARLNQDYRSFLDRYRSLASVDDLFLTSLGKVEAALQRSKNSLEFDATGCQESTRAKLGKLKESVNSLAENVSKLRTYVAKAARKRESLLNLAAAGQKLELEKRFSQHTLIALDDVRKQIQSIFYAGDLISEVSRWRHGRRSLIPCYKSLEFERCITAIEADEARGMKIRHKVTNAQLFDGNSQTILAEIDFQNGALEKEKADFISKGWKNFFEMQKLNVVEGIIAYPDAWPPTCMSSAKTFESLIAGVTDLASYRPAEIAYTKIATLCLFPEMSKGATE